MSPIDRAAKALYEHQIAVAQLAAPPSWESLTPSDHALLLAETRVVLREYFLSRIEGRAQ